MSSSNYAIVPGNTANSGPADNGYAPSIHASSTSISPYRPNPQTSETDPIHTATGVYVTVHGHFYQPPRENPYLDVIECQPSAAPAHDWNERIHYECYRPNAFARVLNDRGEIVNIVNNFEYLSFNIGATLMAWLERYDVETYQRILEGDYKSCARLNGHGNAIAQVYNHMIMPLANQRDKYTQIRWGKADFRARFNRDPEGMWLAETAVDYPTLEALIHEGIRFIILAPSQAQRCRPLPSANNPNPTWLEVGGGQIDPTRPYRCYLKPTANAGTSDRQPALGHDRDASNTHPYNTHPYIDIFFYDGPISRDMGFSDDLFNAQRFAQRIGQAVRGDHRPAQLIAVATDGETFGHHKKGTEKTLAYAFSEEFCQRGWTVTNFAHYLSVSPPEWEVELKPVTAWSCSHGVDRWQADCGCGGGGGKHQKWRKPLRESLDWLREQLVQVYETAGSNLFTDPWQARDNYIHVVLDRRPETVDRFLSDHGCHAFSEAEQIDALRLLEMQRHALLMYTSCGWFFEEISRLEGVQILRYAARALELAGEVTGVQLESEFIQRLSAAPSNQPEFEHGGDVYRQQVKSAQVTTEQVVAQYVISSLFKIEQGRSELGWNDPPTCATNLPLPTQEHPLVRLFCYNVRQLDYQRQRMGVLTLAVGHLQVVSSITWERRHLVFAVLHLGGWDFHCCVQPFTGRLDYSTLKNDLVASLEQASAAEAILAINRYFGDKSYGLKDLLAEDRHRIMHLLSQETLIRLDQLYTQVYRDNYGVLMAFHRDGWHVPQELQVAAEVALSHRASICLRSLEQEFHSTTPGQDPLHNALDELLAIAREAAQLRCQLKLPNAAKMLQQLILRSLWSLLYGFEPAIVEPLVNQIDRLIQVGQHLNLNLCLDQPQEVYYHRFHIKIAPLCLGYLQRQALQLAGISTPPPDVELQDVPSTLELRHLRQLLHLGKLLGVEVDSWLARLG